MKKVLGGILLVVYSIIAIAVTVLLLSFNEYNCSEIGGYTVYIVNDDALEPEYKQGSILIIKGTTDKNVQIGDEIFLYKVINSQEYELVSKTLAEKAQQGRHITYVADDNEMYASDYFIGKASDTVVIEGWGYLLALLESKWGYLFCVVIVSLLLFLQEVFELVMEIKYGGGKANKNNNAEYAVEVEGDVGPARSPARSEGAPRRTTATKTTTASRSASTGAARTTASRSASTGAARTTASRSASTGAARTTSRTSASTGATRTTSRTSASTGAARTTATKTSGTATRKTGTATKTASTARKTSATRTTKTATAVKDENEANVEEE